VFSGGTEHCPIDHKVPKYDLEALRRWGDGVIVPVPEVECVEAEELADTARGAGGFGSTGKQ
jgi:dUTPase